MKANDEIPRVYTITKTENTSEEILAGSNIYIEKSHDKIQIIVNGKDVFPSLVKGIDDLITSVFGDTGKEMVKQFVLQMIEIKMKKKQNKEG
ncbi:MAG: hypothetical protein KatS3mg087_0545 [Patescibacteria group bacterium]|nr:MAG: hypothetical protein KatS3mg087_0545 [Patescibacteria group bacterium]